MSRNAETIRDLRAKAVAAGLCQQCRCRPQKPGRVTCIECLARCSKTKKRLIEEHRAENLCPCGSNPTRGFKTCAMCRKDSNRRQISNAERRMAAGLCRRCGDAPVPGLKHCQSCLDRAARYARRAA